ncbi:expressed unknown protein [Seminavis robusta]|uniref:Uncharacterized protein n=1 Tax=Seminavis robusta TaxID=568900 RepID=A0A9N8HS92_9STRA|nr:expressed unknown protein [Seminavis robusta]|eukprot:Sro1413_g270540.1 n/a (557) ;mRNA; r:3627-5297
MAAEESKMDYRDVKFDFTVPSFDTYDIEDIEDIEDVQDFPDFAAPTTAVLDLPEIPDIPDVTADFDYDYGGVPNFTVPDTTTAKHPSTDSSSKQNKSSKKKKKEKKKKDDDYEHVVNDPWQLTADNAVVSEEEEGGEEEKKSASNTTSNKKDKKKNKSSKTTTYAIEQEDTFDPVGITAAANNKLDMSSAPLKLSLDGEDEEDDEEYKQKAKALLEEHLKQPLEDIESFPRKGKNPKKPKRDQEDIPKTLVTGGTKTQRQLSIRQLATAESTEQPPPQTTTEPPQPTTTRPPAITTTTTSANNNKNPARPLIVQEGGADIASLLFEGAASMEERQVEIALEELSQAFLSSHTKCTEAIDLGGHGIVVVTMRKWGYNKKIQQLGCECLHNIVFNYKQHPMQLDLFDALAVMGALETVIEGMDQFPESLGVQRFGLAALGNLLVGKKTSTRLQARTHKAVQELDAITTVVGGMRRFPNNVMVQGCGCIVLAAFLKANPGDYKSKIVEAGAVLDVAAAVTNHPANALIEKEASAFMKVYFGWQQQLTAASSAASTVNGV